MRPCMVPAQELSRSSDRSCSARTVNQWMDVNSLFTTNLHLYGTDDCSLVGESLGVHKPHNRLSGTYPVEEAGEVHMHHVTRGSIDQDVLAMPVTQAHNVTHLQSEEAQHAIKKTPHSTAQQHSKLPFVRSWQAGNKRSTKFPDKVLRGARWWLATRQNTITL